MSRFSLPALRACQNGTEMFLVAISARCLADLTITVERFDASLFGEFHNGDITEKELLARQGYQRSVETNRVNRFAGYLKQDLAISPTVLLVNDRDGGCKYDDESGELTFDTEVPMFIFDGQHRKDGYIKAVMEQSKLGTFPVFVVITVGIDKRREMEQFQVINGTAKGVKTNLVIEIKANLHDDAYGAKNPKDAKKIACNHAMHFVNFREGSPWRGTIIMASQTKVKKSELRENPELENQRILGSASFIESLGPVYDYLDQHGMWGSGTSVTVEKRGERMADIVIELWKAIRELMPEPFEAPKDYLLQKSIGCLAIHRVLQYLLKVMYTARREWTADEFKIMIKPSEWFNDTQDWENKDSKASLYGSGGNVSAQKLASEIIDDLQNAPVTS